MAQTVTVRLAARDLSYPILIGADLVSTLPQVLADLHPQAQRVMMIVDPAVAESFGALLKIALEKASYTVLLHSWAGGEAGKTLESVAAFYDSALAFGLKRSDVVVALGGGITGDITGFFAATYLRGVAFIQVPTTLLAQVDASVGGKVAVNRQGLKNMVGAFYQPTAVIIDPATLNTLPQRELLCGLAEVIKTALLECSVPDYALPEPSLWQVLSALSPDTLMSALPDLIARCCTIKAHVVAADPEEKHGIREILNLGHTFAHAYETLSEGRILHGEAVSLGLVMAMRLSVQLGMIAPSALEQLVAVMTRLGLMLHAPEAYPAEAMLAVMAQDKKNTATGQVRLILPVDSLGAVRVRADVSREDIEAVLNEAATLGLGAK